MENISFEKALQRLEEIVDLLESGSLDLQASIEIFEEGIALSVRCQQELQKAEGRVQQLVKKLEGGWELADI
ncbi:MAG: exodeoxyribonuclease VII small subunit [Syntrophomonadaceae bacterium]|nr:exodeoxyribonuclease VII small subunit [Syntrophomonadaceae bacterium]